MKRMLLSLTLAVSVLIGGCAQSCPTALLTGVLIEQEGALAVAQAAGPPIALSWPAGYGIKRDGSDLVVTDALGSVVAREGDTVELGGGQTPNIPDQFTVCGSVKVTG